MPPARRNRDGWKARAAHIGQPVRVSGPGEAPWTGVVMDLSSSGALIVSTDTGETREVVTGDVTVISD